MSGTEDWGEQRGTGVVEGGLSEWVDGAERTGASREELGWGKKSTMASQ